MLLSNAIGNLAAFLNDPLNLREPDHWKVSFVEPGKELEIRRQIVPPVEDVEFGTDPISREIPITLHLNNVTVREAIFYSARVCEAGVEFDLDTRTIRVIAARFTGCTYHPIESEVIAPAMIDVPASSVTGGKADVREWLHDHWGLVFHDGDSSPAHGRRRRSLRAIDRFSKVIS